MAKSPRPRTLAAGFGAFFFIVGFFAWTFSQSVPAPGWYPADITRWVYSTYMILAAIFLVGLGGLGLSIRKSIAQRIRELDERTDMSGDPISEALPPPLPDNANTKDTVDRDIDELLESLSEVEEHAQRQAQAMDIAAERATVDNPRIEAQRAKLVRRQKFLGRYLFGPGIVAGLILGISGFMLPGADGFAQSNFHLNTALILGIGYSWVGIGWYVAATVYALVSAQEGGRRK
jgi:hypothetical protein